MGQFLKGVTNIVSFLLPQYTRKQIVNSNSYTFTTEISDEIWETDNDSCRLSAQPTFSTVKAQLLSGGAYFSLSALTSNGQFDTKLVRAFVKILFCFCETGLTD